MPNFTDVLSIQLEDIKPLKPLPAGQYLALINDYETTQKGKNNTSCIVFKLRLMQALDQTPAFQEQLYDALDGRSLNDIPISHILWLTPDSMYRTKIFFEDHLGIRGMAINQALANAVGKQLIVTIGHYVIERENEPPRVAMEIKSTAKA
jgi:hypothetical protein